MSRKTDFLGKAPGEGRGEPVRNTAAHSAPYPSPTGHRRQDKDEAVSDALSHLLPPGGRIQVGGKTHASSIIALRYQG